MSDQSTFGQPQVQIPSTSNVQDQYTSVVGDAGDSGEDLEVASPTNATMDHDIRFHFVRQPITLQKSHHVPRYNFTIFFSAWHFYKIRLCTRKWIDISENQPTGEIPNQLGMLLRLPTELRWMIYDLAIATLGMEYKYKPYRRDWKRQDSLLPPRGLFHCPAMAHVCRDMRQYVMPKYRQVCLTVKLTQPLGLVPELTRYYMGVFNPQEDSLSFEFRDPYNINRALVGGWSYEYGYFGFALLSFSIRAIKEIGKLTMEWRDPFEAPTFTNEVDHSLRDTSHNNRADHLQSLRLYLHWPRDWPRDPHLLRILVGLRLSGANYRDFRRFQCIVDD
ncbi:hypothetical protein NPX13_g8900 [Xylaria arbuscula]|uniref:2EXR domain-containing protein n=1 Tax=Xylaria arbuscula TaxID=114810 RepID=A0A9W8TJE4_9PEZI|nr:hypothetical protein NPX13_g8900 [Xylaria arbuscula]